MTNTGGILNQTGLVGGGGEEMEKNSNSCLALKKKEKKKDNTVWYVDRFTTGSAAVCQRLISHAEFCTVIH